MKNSTQILLKNARNWILILTCCFGFVGTTKAALDSKGTDFWLMFNDNFDNTATMTLFITSDVNTSGIVSGLSFAAIPFNVVANTVTSVSVPSTLGTHANDVVDNKGIHITALNEVTVYGLNQRAFSTDAYLGLPTDVLGTEYIVLTYKAASSFFGNGCEFGIVGTVNGTTVTITPTVTTAGHPVGVPYNIILNQGETYQLLNFTSSSSDLTGTLISSNQPIGVMGAAQGIGIPSGAFFADHICEMLPSVSEWGKKFVTVPLRSRINGDTWRILASENGTVVTINGVPQPAINKGQIIEIILTTQSVIESDKPVLVAQYANGSSFSGNPGDPFMMLIPPYEQFLAGYTLTTVSGFVAHYINVVAPNAIVGTLTLDGVPVAAAEFTPIGASGFSGAQLSVLAGSHTLSATLPFGAFQYGFNDDDAYGYPGGQSFAPIATVNTLVLTPETGTDAISNNHCWEALVSDQFSAPVVGVRVDFNITGPNSSSSGFAFTDANGIATFCYTGAFVGMDNIQAITGTVSDASTFTWTNPCTGVNIDDGNNCTIDACNSLNGVITHINDSPVVSATAGTIDCYGGTTCVTVTAIGGQPGYSGTGELCGYSQGTYEFDVTDGKGCTVTSASVTISEPTKLLVATSTTPSSGADGTATATASDGTPGYTYLWSPGGQTTNPAIGLAPDLYVVKVTDDNGCTSTATALVLPSCVLTAPEPIVGPDGLCKKQSGIVYCVTPNPSATSYIWVLPKGITAVGATNGPCITVKVSTKFKGGFICVQGVTSCGNTANACKNLIAYKKKPATPGNIAGPSTLCLNETATYSIAPVPNATSYSWKVEGNISILSGQGTTSIVVKSAANWNHGKVKVKAVNCKGHSGERHIHVDKTAGCRVAASMIKAEVPLESLTALTAFPNPTNGKTTVTFNSDSKTNYTLKLTDLIGKVLMNEVLSVVEGYNTKEIILENMSKGIYIVSIQNESGTSKSLRLLIE